MKDFLVAKRFSATENFFSFLDGLTPLTVLIWTVMDGDSY